MPAVSSPATTIRPPIHSTSTDALRLTKPMMLKKNAARHGPPQRHLHRLADAVAVARALVRLADEALHHADLRERLLGDGAGLGHLVHHPLRRLAQPLAEEERRAHHDRHDDQRHQREVDVGER